ncbi:hypothetical protein L9F63_027687, partial [Diploptera punctata]
MAHKRKKKYKSGEGNRYVSRKTAMKMLQLTLKDFRKLCILKGVYPREPRNRKRAQQGKAGIKTLYQTKDIQFLMHEPIIWKLREYKIFAKKMGKAKALRDFEAMKRYLDNHPHITLDHIVKERYPSFIDALRDLDDCLSLVFLFSTFPSLKHVPRHQSALCRRLSMEFLHAIIASRALRKVFISIKGYYYQAEIKGQTITWIVPHHFSFVPQSTLEVDFRIMSTFVEFYCIMLGFVNYRLYHLLNLHYPPTFAPSTDDPTEKMLVDEEVFVAERVAALNIPLLQTGPDATEEDIEIDEFAMILSEDPAKLEEARKEIEKVKKLKLYSRIQGRQLEEKKKPIQMLKKKMSVSVGEVTKEDPNEKKKQQTQENKLREKMIKKKHRGLYKSMMKGRRERGKEVWLLERNARGYRKKRRPIKSCKRSRGELNR